MIRVELKGLLLIARAFAVFPLVLLSAALMAVAIFTGGCGLVLWEAAARAAGVQGGLLRRMVANYGRRQDAVTPTPPSDPRRAPLEEVPAGDTVN